MGNLPNGKEDSNFNFQGYSDQGRVRQNNEDFFGYFMPQDPTIREKLGSLFAISDGVGGSQAGEVASAEAVNVLLQEFYFGEHTEKIPDRLKDAYNFTSLHIFDLSASNASCNRMMCTLTALLIRQNKFYISHIGDSKAFLLRNGKLIQMTKDHSMVGKLLRLGMITQEEARTHPNKHIILRSLGERPILPADFYSGNLMEDDVFFMTTDGIFEHLTYDEIRMFLSEKKHISEGLEKLLEIANERGGEDNMTVMTIDASGYKKAQF